MTVSFPLSENIIANGDYVMIETTKSIIAGACYTRLTLLNHTISQLIRISPEGLKLLSAKNLTSVPIDFTFDKSHNRILRITGVDEI